MLGFAGAIHPQVAGIQVMAGQVLSGQTVGSLFRGVHEQSIAHEGEK
jgi:hypothetical protein